MLAINLPRDIDERLSFLAERTGKTKTFYACKAILNYIEDLEDIYLAEKRLADIRAEKSQVIPSQEMERRLGLED